MPEENSKKDSKSRKTKNNSAINSAPQETSSPVQETEKDHQTIIHENLPRSEKNKLFLKTIEIRLDGVGEATRRVKVTYIISIIASCAMLITVFNAYFSFTRTRAFDNSYKYRASEDLEKTNKSKLTENWTDQRRLVEFTGCECSDLKSIYSKIEAIEKQIDENRKPDVNSQKREELNTEKEKTFNLFLKVVNEDILEDPNFYNKISLDNENRFYRLFFTKEKITDAPIELSKEKEKIKSFNEKIKDKISKSEGENFPANLFEDDTSKFYDATNHLNKFIVGRYFPEIGWETDFAGKEAPTSIYEENKRSLARQWLENQNVRIDLLGLSINVDQFSLIGSFALMTISIWMLFSFRRENRSIVTLLRDVRDEVGKPNGTKDNSDEWDIANLAFQGIVHKLVFSQTGQDDFPMSEHNIDFNGKKNSDKTISEKGAEDIQRKRTDYLVAVFTWLARLFAYILLLLPSLSIFLILIIDSYTTTNTLFPYSNNPIEYFINRNISDLPKITAEIYLGRLFGGITIFVNFSCIIIQRRSDSALRRFDNKLKGKILKKSKKAKIIKFLKKQSKYILESI